MSIFNVIEKRRSIRSYLDENVNEDDLKKIVDTGKIAPIAGEFQITVVQNKDLIQKINDVALDTMKNSGNEFLESRAAIPGYQPLYGAPTLILLSAPEENIYGALTTSAAAENIILAATALEYGTCYAITPTLPFISPAGDEIAKELGLPEGFKVLIGVLIGKADESEEIAERAELDNINYVK
ncbi:nitroreductase family protein [Methanobrevibacter filiformis]|nr:nitroreductase family protein [Methanobrevibacter filiformis]